jgi:TonB family protein
MRTLLLLGLAASLSFNATLASTAPSAEPPAPPAPTVGLTGSPPAEAAIRGTFPLRTDVWRKDPTKPAEKPTIPRPLERVPVEKPVNLPRGFYHATVGFVIEADGSVHDAVIIASSGLIVVDEAFLAMMKKWKFEPAKLDGKPVAVVSSIPLELIQKKGRQVSAWRRAPALQSETNS